MFNDRILVESPGDLPGIVRLNNMREIHFSRNPKIAAFLHDYEYVQEFGEGIDRMYSEMEKAGLPAPEYRNESFMLNAVIRNGVLSGVINDENGVTNDVIKLTKTEQLILDYITENTAATIDEMVAATGKSSSTIDRTIKKLKEKGVLKRDGANKNGSWIVIK